MVRLRAFHESGNVVIEVSDDGRGFDREKVREKAVARGLIGEADVLTEEETFDLILQAGFSTAAWTPGRAGMFTRLP